MRRKMRKFHLNYFGRRGIFNGLIALLALFALSRIRLIEGEVDRTHVDFPLLLRK